MDQVVTADAAERHRQGIRFGSADAAGYKSAMYQLADGPDETPDQIRELDDTFLLSDPLGYLTSRALMLWSWLGTHPHIEGDSAIAPTDIQVQVNRTFNENGPIPPLAPADVKAQVALDAFSLRHQAAEALARLALAAMEGVDGRATSLWSAIADGPRQVVDLAKRLDELLGVRSAEEIYDLLTPPELVSRVVSS